MSARAAATAAVLITAITVASTLFAKGATASPRATFGVFDDAVLFDMQWAKQPDNLHVSRPDMCLFMCLCLCVCVLS